MSETIADLGQLGAVGGVLRPIDFTVQRDGVAWNLTGYTSPTLRVWDVRTKTRVAITGTSAVTDAANGVVRYTPGATDPLRNTSGAFEGRYWFTPGGGGDPEPSAMFRFSIGYDPGAS